MRERLATLDLDDGDIVGVAVKPIKTGPPLPPPARKTPPPTASIPAAPASDVAPSRRASTLPATPIVAGTTASLAATGALAPPKVPTFDEALVRPPLTTEVEIELGWDAAAAEVAPAWASAASPASPVPASLPSIAPASPPISAAPPSVAPVASPVSVAPPPVSVAPGAPPSVTPPPVSEAPAAPSVTPPPTSMMRPLTPARPITLEAAVMRLSMSDPTDLIFDGMYGLTFARSTGEAAEMCAETLARALGARTVVIHTHDLSNRELRAVGAHGDGDFDIIGSAEPSDDDLVASAVICNQKSVTMRFDGELPRVAPKRLHAVGAPRTVVAAPAMSWGRCLAIVEVIDADERYAARVADSASYVAEQLARFLSAHAA
jgi:hypothetical protein